MNRVFTVPEFKVYMQNLQWVNFIHCFMKKCENSVK